MRGFTILAAALWAATPGVAEDSLLWKTVGDWDVSIDPTIGNGCYTVASWNGGTILRIGLNPQEDNFYMLVGNEKWTSLNDGENYEIEIKFDNKPTWEVSATGLQFNPGEVVYLHAESTKFDFIEEFMRQSAMKISYQGKEIDTLKLTGSSRAFKEVFACQEDVDRRGVSSDPFANSGDTGQRGGRKSADPFAN